MSKRTKRQARKAARLDGNVRRDGRGEIEIFSAHAVEVTGDGPKDEDHLLRTLREDVANSRFTDPSVRDAIVHGSYTFEQVRRAIAQGDMERLRSHREKL